jgi:hypothetical protein
MPAHVCTGLPRTEDTSPAARMLDPYVVGVYGDVDESVTTVNRYPPVPAQAIDPRKGYREGEQRWRPVLNT